MNKTKRLNIFLFLLCNILFLDIALADPVWVDVRSTIEHKISHIEGDLHIPYQDIVDEITKHYPNKETEIKLYCLSGGRSGKAQDWLTQAGYSNVENIGGIADARKHKEQTKKQQKELSNKN